MDTLPNINDKPGPGPLVPIRKHIGRMYDLPKDGFTLKGIPGGGFPVPGPGSKDSGIPDKTEIGVGTGT